VSPCNPIHPRPSSASGWVRDHPPSPVGRHRRRRRRPSPTTHHETDLPPHRSRSTHPRGGRFDRLPCWRYMLGEFSAGDTEMGRGRRPPRPVCGSARYLHGTVGTGRGRGCDGVAASVVCLLYYSPCRAAAGPRSPGCRPRPLDVPCPCPHACCYTPAPHAIPNQKGALGRTGSAVGTTARTSSTPSITNPVPITAIRSPVARRSTT
jgi:hypothetical protein